MADEDFIIRIKQSYDLAKVVGETVTLRAASAGDFTGNCPYHDDKTASFRVNKERYHCFGCGAHGDIIQWVKILKGLTFPQALEILAKGKLIDALDVKPKVRQVPNFSPFDAADRSAIIEINEIAQNYYISGALDDACREYLFNRVNLTGKAVFGIGYAPSDSTSFVNHMLDYVKDPSLLMAAALIAQGADGRYYGRMRDRITIPLTDSGGRILGFAGRIVPREVNAHLPKYINPPNTKAFSRRTYIFGLAQLGPAIARLIIVEGYMDVISLHSRGISNSISTMGTQVTDEQADIIEHLKNTKGYGQLIMMDGDAPGIAAAVDISGKLLARNINPGIVSLPSPEDPDSFVRALPSNQVVKQKLNELPITTAKKILAGITISTMAKNWDLIKLNTALKKYIDDNVRQGFAHYNVTDWVCLAYPHVAPALRAAIEKMTTDPTVRADGVREPKDEHIKEFIKVWIIPSREVRQKHGIKR